MKLANSSIFKRKVEIDLTDLRLLRVCLASAFDERWIANNNISGAMKRMFKFIDLEIWINKSSASRSPHTHSLSANTLSRLPPKIDFPCSRAVSENYFLCRIRSPKMTFHDVGQFVILRIRRLMKSFIKFIQSICAVAHSSRSSLSIALSLGWRGELGNSAKCKFPERWGDAQS